MTYGDVRAFMRWKIRELNKLPEIHGYSVRQLTIRATREVYPNATEGGMAKNYAEALWQVLREAHLVE